MIDLYTARTPNGFKASIALEELDLAYRSREIDLSKGEQKEAWFRDINPNGRIPAIVDRGNDDFAVFESGAILVYLADKAGSLLPREPKARSRVMQWLMFQMGGIGPMQGQAGYFSRYASEHIPFAIERYRDESERLYGVLDKQLADNEFIAGPDYSIADIATFPWVRGHDWSGVDIAPFSNVQRWLRQVANRPAVKRGLAVPVAHKAATLRAAKRLTEARSLLAASGLF